MCVPGARIVSTLLFCDESCGMSGFGQQLAAVYTSCKRRLAAAKGIFGVEYMSAGATIKNNLLRSPISASIKLIINKKRYAFAGTHPKSTTS